MSKLIRDLYETVKEEFEGVEVVTDRELILLIGPFGYDLLLSHKLIQRCEDTSEKIFLGDY